MLLIGQYLWTRGKIVEQGPAKSLFADPKQPRTRLFWKNFFCNKADKDSRAACWSGEYILFEFLDIEFI